MKFNTDGQPSGLHADRYEFWLYGQLRKRLKSRELYLDDSLQYRCFSDERVSLDAKADVLSQMDIPWLRRPIGRYRQGKGRRRFKYKGLAVLYQSVIANPANRRVSFFKQKGALLWEYSRF